MKPENFKAALEDLITAARTHLSMEEIFQIISEQYHCLQGDIWLYDHYNGEPPPRLTKPETGRPKE